MNNNYIKITHKTVNPNPDSKNLFLHKDEFIFFDDTNFDVNLIRNRIDVLAINRGMVSIWKPIPEFKFFREIGVAPE